MEGKDSPITHRAMINSAVKYLQGQGAKNIQYGYKIGNRRLDLRAISEDGDVIGVECGQLYYMEKRLKEVSSEVDIFYWIPVMPLMFKLEIRDMNKFVEGDGYLRCKRCNNVWEPRVEHPKICPRCKRRDWDVDKPMEEEHNEINTGSTIGSTILIGGTDGN